MKAIGRSGDHLTGVASDVRSYENVIPRTRDKRGNPIPRRYISCPTLVTTDPEALLETARVFGDSPDEGLKRYPWLKSRAALAADANMQQIRAQMHARMGTVNEALKEQVKALEKQLARSDELLADLAPEAVSHAAILGLAREPGQSLLPMLGDEPVSLEELAGELSAPTPDPQVGWLDKVGYKLMCAVGGGGLFGLSLGLLSDKIELVDLAEEWPIVALFVVFGIMLVTIIGGVITPITRSIGDSLYRRGIRLPKTEAIAAGLKFAFVAGFVCAAIAIESKVEQLGLLKVVAESSTLQGSTISKAEMLWVSLMLVVPVVGLYLVWGLTEGERRANLAYLRSQQAKRRRLVMDHPGLSGAVAKLEALRIALSVRAELKARIDQLNSEIRDDLTVEEKRQLEDLQMDVITHSRGAEQALLSLGGNRRRLSVGGNWWARLLGRSHLPFGGRNVF